MTTAAYDITNTTGNSVQVADANGNPVAVDAGVTVTNVLLTSAGYAALVGIFGAANIVAYVAPPVPPTPQYQYVEGAVVTGQQPQYLFSSAVPVHGFEIINNSATLPLYFREADPATLGPPSTELPPLCAYETPVWYVPTGPISVVALDTAHPYTGRFF